MAADVEVGGSRRTESMQITLVLPWGRAGGPALAATVLAVAQLVWYAVELSKSYFQQDDFALLYLGGSQPLGELLLRDYSGHLQPGMFVVCKLITSFAPLNWTVAAGLLVVLHGLAVVLLWRLLRLVFGQRWAILVPFVLITCSPPTFVMTMWWAYGMQLLPTQLALIGALYAHARHLDRPNRWHAAQGVLWTVFGLAFWEKAMLIPVILFGVTVALADGGLWTRIVTAVRRATWLWACYVALLAVYSGVHVRRTAAATSDALTWGNVWGLIKYMLGDALPPAMFGGPWNGKWVGFDALASPDTWILVVSWTGTLLVLAAGLWFGRWRGAAAWFTLLGYIGTSVLLVSLTRLTVALGPILGADRRYIADIQVVAVLLAAVAVLAPRIRLTRGATLASASTPATDPAVDPATDPSAAGVRRTGPRRVPSIPWDRLPLWAPIGVLAVIVLGTVLSITPALPYQQQAAGRTFVENVRSAAADRPGLTLYDTSISGDAMSALFGDFTKTSRALYGLGLKFDEPTLDLRMLDGDGIPRKVGLVAVVTSSEGPAEGCGYLLGKEVVRVPLNDVAEGDRLVARVGWYAQEPSDGAITTPNQRVPVRFEAGLHEVSIVVDGPFDEVLLEADGPVCVGGVMVGLPLPHMDS